MHANHPNWRGDLPLLSKCVGAGRGVSMKQSTRIMCRYVGPTWVNHGWRRYTLSTRVVKPWGRTAKSKLKQWSNGDKTFTHLALGINHKVNRWR
jgi:hypothetical protein